jgi:exonuclease VII small subunit
MAELGTPKSRSDVSVSLNHVAGIERARGNLDSALARYEEGLEIRRALMAKLGTPDSRHDASISLHHVAVIEQECGNLDGALARYEEGLEIRRALTAELGTPESRRDVSLSLFMVASMEQARGDLGRAIARYEEGLQIARALMVEFGTQQYCFAYLWRTDRTATCHLAMNDPDAARAVLQPAEAVASALESDARDDGNVLGTVAAYWERRAEATAHSDPQEASTCAARAASIRTRIADINAE